MELTLTKQRTQPNKSKLAMVNYLGTAAGWEMDPVYFNINAQIGPTRWKINTGLEKFACVYNVYCVSKNA